MVVNMTGFNQISSKSLTGHIDYVHFLSNLGTITAVMGLFYNSKKINALVRYCLLRTKY